MSAGHRTIVAILTGATVLSAGFSPGRAQTAQIAPATAPAVRLAPHRAVYDIALVRTSSGSGVSSLTGRMVYELTGSPCEGFTQNMRFVTSLTTPDGTEQLSDLRTSSWEEQGGIRLRFNSTQLRDGKVEEASQGDASRTGEGGTVKVELIKPSKKSVEIPAGTYFPTQHSVALIESARAGKPTLMGRLYDGSEKGEKIYLTNSVIGKRSEPGTVPAPAKVANADKLAQLASWPISVSYFEPGATEKDEVPSYELTFRLFENGISSGLRIDYGEFSIQGELTELTLLEEAKCEAGKG